MAETPTQAAAADWGSAADAQEKTLVDKVGSLGVGEAQTQPSQNEAEEGDVRPADLSLLKKLMRRGLVTTESDIEVQRSDVNSPLHSVKSFEDLNLRPELLKGVYCMGFNKPSKIQETALPALLADPPENMIAQSQSGTGKTAAFTLAMLSRVDVTQEYPQVICLSPTYELALQTGEVASKMSQFATEITIRYAVRGETIPRGSTITEHIIIGTPGKIMDWGIKQRLIDFKKVKVFVLDEADIMIHTEGYQEQSFKIWRELSSACQMLLFSATYDKDVMNFAENIIKDPMIISLNREQETINNISQYWVPCDTPEAKYEAIDNLYSVLTIGQAIIFCQTRKGADFLASKLTRDGHTVGMLSGDLSIDQRITVLDRFREGYERVLITTNVMARGIDIEAVTIVVNYDLPVDMSGKANCETYLHRIGRTGRFGKKGLAINLIGGSKDMAVLKEIEAHFGRPINHLNTEDYDEIEKIQN